MEILQADDTLREEILNDARSKADRIIKKAQRESDEIVKNSEDQIKAIEKEYSSNFTGSAEENIKLITASIDIEVKKENTRLLGSIIDDVFKEFKKQLTEEKVVSYKDLISSLIASSASRMKSKSFIIEANSEVLKKIPKDFFLKFDRIKIEDVIVNDNAEEIVLFSGDKKTASFISIDSFLEQLRIHERSNVYKILIQG
jgi:vacuolar-type H+-ATPase subunit E/Vma4